MRNLVKNGLVMMVLVLIAGITVWAEPNKPPKTTPPKTTTAQNTTNYPDYGATSPTAQ